MIAEVRMHVDKKGMEKLRRKLRQVHKETGDAYEANRNVGIWIVRWINKNFDTEGGKVGGWQPFKYGGRLITKKKASNRIGGVGLARSIEGRRLVDASARLLRDTSLMFASFQPYRARSKSVTVGSHLEYSAYHEFGLPSRNLPARRMLPRASDDDVLEGILRIYDDYMYTVTGK
jgi:phage gpG-like protein